MAVGGDNQELDDRDVIICEKIVNVEHVTIDVSNISVEDSSIANITTVQQYQDIAGALLPVVPDDLHLTSTEDKNNSGSQQPDKLHRTNTEDETNTGHQQLDHHLTSPEDDNDTGQQQTHELHLTSPEDENDTGRQQPFADQELQTGTGGLQDLRNLLQGRYY